MANNFNRYKIIYEKMVRPNNASNFPKHVFVRSANMQANIHQRVGNRTNCFESTLLHLTERFDNKEVYLVGTANQSTLLANRTRKLIQEINPDLVLVQSNDEWWSRVRRLLKYVKS